VVTIAIVVPAVATVPAVPAMPVVAVVVVVVVVSRAIVVAATGRPRFFGVNVLAITGANRFARRGLTCLPRRFRTPFGLLAALLRVRTSRRPAGLWALSTVAESRPRLG
jgi:hypothetical protein